MGGVNVEAKGNRGRKSVDSEVNMIPMIDLLVCAISFLLITAVWSHMSRIDANAQVPGPPSPTPLVPQAPDKVLHLEMNGGDKFTLMWKQGPTVVSSFDVPRRGIEALEGSDIVIRYPELATRISQEWQANGSHRADDDSKLDQAVLHTDNKAPFSELVAVIDAVYAPKKGERPHPAFNVTFSIQ